MASGISSNPVWTSADSPGPKSRFSRILGLAAKIAVRNFICFGGVPNHPSRSYDLQSLILFSCSQLENRNFSPQSLRLYLVFENEAAASLNILVRRRLLNYPLRRNDYQNNSVNIFSCNCPGAITGFSCRAPEKNSPKIVSCMGPRPVRAPPVIAPGALIGFSCKAPENNSKIIFSCL